MNGTSHVRSALVFTARTNPVPARRSAGPWISGRKFSESLMTPIPPESLFALVQSGWPPELMFRLTVSTMNGVEDAIKETDKGQKCSKALDHTKLRAAQTPQTFKLELLEKALEKSQKGKLNPADDAEAVLSLKQEIHLVSASSNNMKIRTPDDLVIASALLRVQ